MFLPNKTIPYSDSVIARFPIILKALKDNNQNIHSLYKKNKKKFLNIQNYVETLDCLYALNKIEFDKTKEEIRLCSVK